RIVLVVAMDPQVRVAVQRDERRQRLGADPLEQPHARSAALDPVLGAELGVPGVHEALGGAQFSKGPHHSFHHCMSMTTILPRPASQCRLSDRLSSLPRIALSVSDSDGLASSAAMAPWRAVSGGPLVNPDSGPESIAKSRRIQSVP